MFIAWGVISIIIGIIILIFPRILNYLVAIWFILTGIGLLIGASCMPKIPGLPF